MGSPLAVTWFLVAVGEPNLSLLSPSLMAGLRSLLIRSTFAVRVFIISINSVPTVFWGVVLSAGASAITAVPIFFLGYAARGMEGTAHGAFP